MLTRFTLHSVTWVGSVFLAVSLLFSISLNVFAESDAPAAVFLPLVSTPRDDSGQVSDLTSEFLINKARQSGKLDDETALLYRVYANFEDSRLPAEYRGNNNLIASSMALREVQARYASLSAETQAALAPFFLPPSAENSWHERREAATQATATQVELSSSPAASNAKIKWVTTCQNDPNIKVWYQERYPEDAVAAHQVCDLVAGEIWPRLESLMGRKPLNDGAEVNNGGDEQMDFYLVNARTGSMGYRGCDNTPSYVTVHRTRWNKALLISAVMGAFLDSYATADCMEYMWLYAATCTWAIDYVDVLDNWEHHYADDYLLHSDIPLDTYPLMPLEEQNEIGDGAYLWVWFATNMLGKHAKELVPFWWQGAMNPDSLAAVNNVMGDLGFDRKWKEFAGLNWNNEPVDVYKDLDKMPHFTKLKLDEEVALNGAQDHSYEFDASVRYLSAHTFRFKFNDPTVRSVLFYNPFQDGAWPTADVQAYYKLADQSWHIEDWTAKYGKGFCRDIEAEQIEELVIVISNDEWKDTAHKLQPAKPPRLNVTNVACRGWEFEGTATWVGTGPEYSKDDSATVKATFMRQPPWNEDNANAIDYYQVVEGHGTWTHTGNHVNCGGSSGGSFEMSGGIHTSFFLFTKATDQATSSAYLEGDRRYSGVGAEGTDKRDLLSVLYSCTSGNNYKVPAASAYNWFKTEAAPTQMVSEDGISITGAYTETRTSDDITDLYTWEWTMTALPPE